MLFGYDVVAELRPGTRYDQVVEALGGRGELVEEPAQLGPALDRAFAADGVTLVNVLTDPADAYPRSSNLAGNKLACRDLRLCCGRATPERIDIEPSAGVAGAGSGEA
jgi:thiamine pyrophosphate-dependent acetolactate synthase large subunit-like protein